MKQLENGWHWATIDGRHYRIEVRDGEVRTIYGRRDLIVPSTVQFVSSYHRYTSVRTDVDPDGRLGRRIVKALLAEVAA